MQALEAIDGLRADFTDDVRVIELAPHVDERGRLLELDFAAVPFEVRRAFAVTGVPAGTTRGGHRHRGVAQLLACVAGAVAVELRRGEARCEVLLTPGEDALYLAPGVWAAQRYVEDSSVLVVLASEPFDPATYDTSY